MGKTGPCQAPISESGTGQCYSSPNRPNSTCPSFCRAPGTGGNTTCSCILPLRRPTGSRSRGRALQCSPKPNRRYARAGGVLLAWCVPHRRGRGVRTAACGNVSRHGQGAGSPPSSPRAQGRARLPPQVRPPRTWAPLLCVGICIPMAGGVVVARPRTVHLHFTSLAGCERAVQHPGRFSALRDECGRWGNCGGTSSSLVGYSEAFDYLQSRPWIIFGARHREGTALWPRCQRHAG